MIIGGCTRTRTVDPLIKSQLLYQLSYTPMLLKPMRFAIVSRCSRSTSDRRRGLNIEFLSWSVKSRKLERLIYCEAQIDVALA